MCQVKFNAAVFYKLPFTYFISPLYIYIYGCRSVDRINCSIVTPDKVTVIGEVYFDVAMILSKWRRHQINGPWTFALFKVSQG